MTGPEWRVMCWVRLNSEPVPGGTAHVHAKSGDPLSEESCRVACHLGERPYKEAVNGLKGMGALKRMTVPGTGVVTLTYDDAVETWDAFTGEAMRMFSPAAPEYAAEVVLSALEGRAYPCGALYADMARDIGCQVQEAASAWEWCVERGLVDEEQAWRDGRACVEARVRETLSPKRTERAKHD